MQGRVVGDRVCWELHRRHLPEQEDGHLQNLKPVGQTLTVRVCDLLSLGFRGSQSVWDYVESFLVNQ